MKIDGFTITQEINRGPITTVYEAIQDELERKVLLKVLNVQWRNEPDLVERFRREAKICARLKHPNIVNIFDFGTTGDSFYLAMEFVEGQTLAHFLQKHHPIPFPAILYIFKEILKGLAYAHQEGIIHRDIKPSNIMVGTEGVIKITDFGLATIEGFPSVTAQGGVVGSPAYLAPEQAQGKKIDHRSDLFSLGVTFYELCTKIAPFRGKSLPETIQNVLKKDPPPISDVRADIPDWFSSLVQQLMNKQPQKRPESAQSILEHHLIQKFIFTEGNISKYFISPQSFSSEHGVTETEEKTPRKKKFKNIYYLLALFFIIFSIALYKLQFADKQRQNMPKQQILADTLSRSVLTVIDKPIAKQSIPPAEPAKKSEESPLPEKKFEINTKVTEKSPASTQITTEYGGIFIKCYPWGEIYIDGQKMGTTPLKKALRIASGRHLLEVQNPNFFLYRDSIRITADRIDTIEVTLQPRIGYLSLSVFPWAKVYIDGKYISTTPLQKPIALAAGKHTLKLEHPQYGVQTQEIWIPAGETLKKKIILDENKKEKLN